jgi:hypothetical protein
MKCFSVICLLCFSINGCGGPATDCEKVNDIRFIGFSYYCVTHPECTDCLKYWEFVDYDCPLEPENMHWIEECLADEPACIEHEETWAAWTCAYPPF